MIDAEKLAAILHNAITPDVAVSAWGRSAFVDAAQLLIERLDEESR